MENQWLNDSICATSLHSCSDRALPTPLVRRMRARQLKKGRTHLGRAPRLFYPPSPLEYHVA